MPPFETRLVNHFNYSHRMATERVLSSRELNRALLARQFLLEPSPMPLVRTIEQVAGLQTQYAPSGYIGLWTRMRDFRRATLTTALEQHRVVQGTLLRSTIHTVSARDYPLFLAAVRESRREWFRRITRKEFGDIDMEAGAAALSEQLRSGPRRASQLKIVLAAHGIPPVAWAGIGLWLDLVRIPPSGTWDQRRADLYGLAEGWIRMPALSEDAAQEHVVRRYLGGFGPASVNDIADWAGIPATRLLPIVHRLSLRQFRDANGKPLVDLPRAPLPDAATPAPVRFLPTWDATLLVHARRSQILPERYRPLVFNTKTPQSVPTFLVDGAVAGTWRSQGAHITITPFEPLPRSVRRDVAAEAKRLEAFLR